MAPQSGLRGRSRQSGAFAATWLNVKAINSLWTALDVTFLPGIITDLVVYFKLKPFNR